MDRGGDEVGLVVVVDPDRLEAVLPALDALGATVEHTMWEIGVVCCRVPRTCVPAVAGIDGVLEVEQERELRLPEPTQAPHVADATGTGADT